MGSSRSEMQCPEFESSKQNVSEMKRGLPVWRRPRFFGLTGIGGQRKTKYRA